MVVTTKHHDGFCMFDAHNTDWKITNTPSAATPSPRSPGLRAQGRARGLYYSIMDWWHPDYLPRLEWEADRRPPRAMMLGAISNTCASTSPSL